MQIRKTLIVLSAFVICFTSISSHAFVGGEKWDDEAAKAGVDPSYTLPILHIETENGAVINQKEEYINGAYWLETSHLMGGGNIGSPEAPLKLGIKGRGNASWLYFDKKPYKLKLDKKQSILGMPKSKHFAILPFLGGFPAYFAHPLGFEIGRYLIKGWTPRISPVEVILNGQYIGLYVLTETVRIEEGRVDIFEQPEDNENPETLTGGYLVEIDNYTDANQLIFWENPTTQFLVTVATPEPMNELHEKYLTEQFNAMSKALYNPDKLSRDWEELIDAESYARHFVVEEIMNNIDAYNGSVKIHKDLGQKWTFGPLWDSGDSFDKTKDDFTFNVTPYRCTWIPQTYQFPRFVKLVQKIWREFREIDDSVWTDFLESWDNSIKQAEVQNQKVWKYHRGSSSTDRMNYAKACLKQHIEWLENTWGKEDLTHNVSVNVEGAGKVLLGGHEFADVDIFDSQDLVVTINPQKGYGIRSLMVNGENALKSMDNGIFNLTAVKEDTQIDVEFAKLSSISDATDYNAVWSIDGKIITSSAPARIYNLSGVLIGEGFHIELPENGIYIIKAGNKTEKIIL